MSARSSKDASIRTLRSCNGQGVYTAVIDLLSSVIAESHEEMESATDNITIWRAQGKATAARDLIAAMKPRDAE